MVPDLMGDDVSLGKITGGSVAHFEVIEKGQVNIQLLIAGTVERSHCGTGITAGGIYTPCKQHQCGFPVVASQLPKDRVPGIFGIAQHHRHELGHLLIGLTQWG